MKYRAYATMTTKLYLDIEADSEDEACVELEISVCDGFDGRDDKGETVRIPVRIRKKIVKQLCSDKLLGDELTAWIESFKEDES